MVITFSNPLIVLIPLILNSLIVKMNEEPDGNKAKNLHLKLLSRKRWAKLYYVISMQGLLW